MARRASGSKVSYKELDSDGDDGTAPWGLSDDDDDADLKALKAAAPLAKKRKKAGTQGVGDLYGARRPQRKKPKKTKAQLPAELTEDCKPEISQKDADDGKPFKRVVDDDSDESESEGQAASNGPNAAATESNAADEVEVAGFSGELLLKLPFEMFAEICSHFELRDLVRLARTSKKLHEILLARTARSIWARCRERMGYILPTDMSEIQFALFIAGESCQHCGSARGAYNYPYYDQFLASEVTEVNNTLVRLQALDDAARALLAQRSLWTTRSRRTEILDEDSLRTDHVARYVSERKGLTDRFQKEGAQVHKNYHSIRRREQEELAQIAKEAARQLKNRVKITVKQLRDNHGWTAADTAKVQQGMTAYHVTHPYSLAPKTLPDDDRDGWTAFQVKYRAWIEEEAERARQSERYRQCQKLLEQTYATMTLSLEAELLFVPSWNNIQHKSSVLTFLRATTTPGQDGASHDPEILRATLLAAAKQNVRDERVAAIRGIVAAHLDIPEKQLSKKEDDYPTDVYDEAFFQKIPNRFAVTPGRPRTFQQLEKQNNAKFSGLNIRRSLSEWRRATRHVLLAAGKEASSDLDEVDALGASFAWQNGPKSTKAQRYTWEDMVEEIVEHGPRGLRLSDLKDIKIIYTPIKGKGKEKALDRSNDNVRRKKIVDDSEHDSSRDDSDA